MISSIKPKESFLCLEMGWERRSHFRWVSLACCKGRGWRMHVTFLWPLPASRRAPASPRLPHRQVSGWMERKTLAPALTTLDGTGEVVRERLSTVSVSGQEKL